MSDKTLEEKIAQKLCELNHYIWNHDIATNEKYLSEARGILSLITESAKELGELTVLSKERIENLAIKSGTRWMVAAKTAEEQLAHTKKELPVLILRREEAARKEERLQIQKAILDTIDRFPNDVPYYVSREIRQALKSGVKPSLKELQGE